MFSVNSSAPGKFEWNFRCVIFKVNFSYQWLRHLWWNCPQMNVTGLHSIFYRKLFVFVFFFTRGSFGRRVLSSPVSVCVSVCVSTFACPSDNSSHVPARITWFGWKDAKYFFFPIVLAADWAWPSMSNLTSFQNSVYLHRFCVFEIFVRLANTEFVELFHIPHGAAHIMIPLYARRQGRAMERETVY